MITRNKTVGAGAYPATLCNQWAQACRSAAPPNAFGKSSWHVCNQFLLDLWDAVDTTARAGGTVLPRHDQQSCEKENPNVLFAKRYIQSHPVIFGQHSNAEAERINRRFRKKGQKNHCQAERFDWKGLAKTYEAEGSKGLSAHPQSVSH